MEQEDSALASLADISSELSDPVAPTQGDVDAGVTQLACCPTLRNLSPVILRHLLRVAHVRLLEDRQFLYHQDDAETFTAWIIEGQINLTLQGPDGRELIHASHGPGQIVGESALIEPAERATSAVACGRTRVLQLQQAHMTVLMADPEFRNRITCLLNYRLNRHTRLLETLCLHRLESRLARHLLLVLEEQLEHQGTGLPLIPLPPNQTLLGAMLNASRPKLNAQLQQWVRSGAVQRDRGGLRILDLDVLRAAADSTA